MSYKSKSITGVMAGVLLAAGALPARAADPETAPPPPTHHHSQKKPAAPPPLVLPPLPAGPLRQVPMDQLPESAPHVTYQSGLLTIGAQNATLAEILKEVQKLTGASIEIPTSGAPERVVTQLGPGAPRDVLATLLNGTQFNYVMLGSSSDPKAVASIVLTSKPGSGGSPEEQTIANNVPQQNGQMVPGRVPPAGAFRQQMIAQQQKQADAAAADADDSTDADENNKEDEADPAQPAPPAATQPDANNQSDQQNPNQPNAGPKTPEQLLEMMRQQQQGQPPRVGDPVNPPPAQPPQE